MELIKLSHHMFSIFICMQDKKKHKVKFHLMFSENIAVMPSKKSNQNFQRKLAKCCKIYMLLIDKHQKNKEFQKKLMESQLLLDNLRPLSEYLKQLLKFTLIQL